MPANFDSTNAKLHPNKNIEDMNYRKNKENTSNENQMSEKEEQRKRKFGRFARCIHVQYPGSL